MQKETDIRNIVREKYGDIAKQGTSCCPPKGASSCCGAPSPADTSKKIGYSDSELMELPEGVNLGLGCGNPTALAELRPGETVLDLGAGAGIDCFLAAQKVGPTGKIIGVDMTPEMVSKARENALKVGVKNVEFRLGEIEHLPVADSSVDIVISNCVINLIPDKKAVFQEVFRALKPGGRILISDIVLEKPLPEFIKQSVLAYVGCVAGAILKNDYIEIIRSTGFKTIEILSEQSYTLPETFGEKLSVPKGISVKEIINQASDAVRSVSIRAVKPV
jgi:SAM-dependent methyltransferase